LQELEQH
jgi:chromosome segregation ATPase